MLEGGAEKAPAVSSAGMTVKCLLREKGVHDRSVHMSPAIFTTKELFADGMDTGIAKVKEVLWI